MYTGTVDTELHGARDIGPFLADDTERMAVAEKLVDLAGTEAVVSLVCRFLKGQSNELTSDQILDGCTAMVNGIRYKQEGIRGEEDIGEPNGRCVAIVQAHHLSVHCV